MVELETKVVASGTPLKSIIDAALKFAPLTVSVKAEDPAAVEDGVIEARVGTGFVIFAVVVGWVRE
jgi:hypothetical protein